MHRINERVLIYLLYSTYCFGGFGGSFCALERLRQCDMKLTVFGVHVKGRCADTGNQRKLWIHVDIRQTHLILCRSTTLNTTRKINCSLTTKEQGPVVQIFISLTTSLRCQFFKYMPTTLSNPLLFLLKKCENLLH